jgi:hypothetical protein
MRYLFLMLALLGLVTAGDLRGPRVPSTPAGRRPLTHTASTGSMDVATIADDGTPVPRRQ